MCLFNNVVVGSGIVGPNAKARGAQHCACAGDQEKKKSEDSQTRQMN